MNNNEEYLAREKRRLAEGQVKIDKLKGIVKEHDDLLVNGTKLLERAYDIHMEGDRWEDWQAFEKCMRAATSTFKDAIVALNKLEEIIPSQVEPEQYKMLKDIIARTDNALLTYWRFWGKRLKQEEVDRVMTLTHWSCAMLQAHGIPHGDMESVKGENLCHNKCQYRKTCDREGL